MEDMTCQIEKVGFRRFVEKFEFKRFLKRGTGKCVPKVHPPLTDAQVISADPGNNGKFINQFG